jgi:cathepsin L
MDLPFDVDTVDKLPSSIDWRESKVVTEVRNQGGCGSCWAFSAIEVLESHVALQTGNLLDLSEQELLSCMSNPHQCGGNGGCAGANAELAYDFVAKMGIVTDADMTYVSANGTVPACALDNDEKYNKNAPKGALVGLLTNAAVSIDGFSHIPTNDYVTLMNAVAKAGPVVVAVAASDWGLYKEGIFTDDGSQSADINHGVALVGYGTDEELGEDYWLVRNSWGKSWGKLCKNFHRPFCFGPLNVSRESKLIF